MQCGELLIFPTSIGDQTYLNAAESTPSQLVLLEEKGWTNEAINKYLILRFSVPPNDSGERMHVGFR